MGDSRTVANRKSLLSLSHSTVLLNDCRVFSEKYKIYISEEFIESGRLPVPAILDQRRANSETEAATNPRLKGHNGRISNHKRR